LELRARSNVHKEIKKEKKEKKSKEQDALLLLTSRVRGFGHYAK